MEAREQRGLAIAALCRIIPEQDGTWLVPSQSKPGHYRVNLNPLSPKVPMCTCPDYEERGEPCKHVFAVQFVVKRETHADGSVTVTETLTITGKTTAERPTYRQNWPAYNAAQTHEKEKFQELLYDLCQGIAEPPTNPRGRPRKPLCDMLFSCAFKVYSTFSGRRFQSDLNEAETKGYLIKAPHYNTVFDYLEDKALTPILRRLVVESSLPLREIETDFAVDSTGLSSSRFARWFDHKYGRMTKEHEWIKLHLVCGVKTNIVTAVEVTDRDTNDSPLLPALTKTTARNFHVKEVSADKGYIGTENAEAITRLGAVPYIAFKRNNTGNAGGVFERMYLRYCLNREDYLEHYHKRSNIESTVNMIKAKFGDAVRSKTLVAMTNEALCKVLCHNLCCLVLSAYELGVVADFWGKNRTPRSAQANATTEVDEIVAAMAWI
jgi:transposase